MLDNDKYVVILMQITYQLFFLKQKYKVFTNIGLIMVLYDRKDWRNSKRKIKETEEKRIGILSKSEVSNNVLKCIK